MEPEGAVDETLDAAQQAPAVEVVLAAQHSLLASPARASDEVAARAAAVKRRVREFFMGLLGFEPMDLVSALLAGDGGESRTITNLWQSAGSEGR